jgi:hypothetical protein
MATEDSGRPFGRRGAGKPPCLETPASARACELATLVLDCRAEGWPAMNDLSAFDGDAERGRQICDLRIRGKTEAEVCQMLGCTVPGLGASVRVPEGYQSSFGSRSVQ